MTSAITIESIIQRPGGTRGVVLGSTSYDFLPNEQGAHVCQVTDSEHAQTFLGIPEGYRIYAGGNGITVDGGIGATAAPQETAAEPLPPEPETVAVATAAPQEPAGEPATTEVAPSDPAKPLADMDTAELRKVFEEELGRTPHPKAKDETMIASIEAKRAEES